MSLDALPFGIAHHMALVPLLWLAVRHERRIAWWWIAGVFAVSWIADSLAHVVSPILISAVYPVSQAAIVGAVLLERERARTFLLGLAALSALAVLPLGLPAAGVVIRTLTWGSIAILALFRSDMDRLRPAWLTSFGGGLLAWLGYMTLPSWGTWGVYQSIRALGIGMFCWAQWEQPARV